MDKIQILLDNNIKEYILHCTSNIIESKVMYLTK